MLACDVHPNPGPSTDIAICHANIRSMRSRTKFDEISLTANTNKLDIVTLSETWLTPDIDDSCVNITGFQPIVRKDRVGHAGGCGACSRWHCFYSPTES